MKKISASGIKFADIWIRIAKKTHEPPRYRLSEKWMTPPYMQSLKTGDPPYILPPLRSTLWTVPKSCPTRDATRISYGTDSNQFL